MTRHARQVTARASVALLAAVLVCVPGTANAQPGPSEILRVDDLLRDSGYKYTRVTSNSAAVWTVPFTRDALGSTRVIVSTDKGVLVSFVTVVEGTKLRKAPELLMKMLQINNSLDQVKIGFDEDGDAFVRIDEALRLVDAQEMKAVLDQLSAAAEELFIAMRPFINR